MLYIEIDGDSDTITILSSIGFEVVSTYPNPYPQPYYFVLMRLNTPNAKPEFIADKTFRNLVYGKIIRKSRRLSDRFKDAQELKMYIDKCNPLDNIAEDNWSTANELPF